MNKTDELLSHLGERANKNFLKDLSIEREELKQRKPYQEILKSLENFTTSFTHQTSHLDFKTSEVSVGKRSEISDESYRNLIDTAKTLIPWKKGPFNIYNQVIDAEWRSELKWERIEHSLGDQTGKKVLDIGCNNGYFMFRLLSKNPSLILGIDPVVPNLVQFNFLNHLIRDSRLYFELWGVEHLKYMEQSFDTILSMGILYHHRNPIEQLIETKKALKPGGEAIIETMAIPGEQSYALFPEGRYAKMRNVWFFPTPVCLKNWLVKARFCEIEHICTSELNSKEQRLTDWCPPPRQSLEDFLDPNDDNKTIEGHPAPIRIVYKAKRHKDDKQ